MSKDIDLLIHKRHINRRGYVKKKNQIPQAISICIISLLVGTILWKMNPDNIFYWLIGIAIGFVLRKSRFCLCGAFRDPFLFNNTKLLRGVIITIIINTLGFGIIQYYYLKGNIMSYDNIPGNVTSFGWHIAIGAFIFGIGMVIAGGCASGILMRIGEGHALPWIVFIGMIIGNLLGAKDYSFWYDKIIKNSKVIYFPEYFDIRIAIAIQIIILIIIYKFLSFKEKRNFEEK